MDSQSKTEDPPSLISPSPDNPRLELILQQLESLPTLPAVAMRLLQVTGDEAAEAQQVIELVRGDPALTAKVLAMVRSVDRGVRQPVVTVDRAVLLLGFEAIRNAVLSIKVFEMFADEPASQGGRKAPAPPGDAPAPAPSPTDAPARFDRAGFWRHSLAVALAAEMIAARHTELIPSLRPSEAFVGGLLHDMGKLALDHLLPKSYERVIELTERHQLNIADVERRVIGLDHHTAGKRLAEHWQLPHVLQDCAWLHGAAHHAPPELKHRMVVEAVAVADLLVRSQHIGYSGNHHLGESLAARSRRAGLDPERVDAVAGSIHEEMERRAAGMGLGATPSRRLFLESIMQANEVLGRLNTRLEEGRRVAAGRGRVLEAIAQFHGGSSRPGRGVQDVLRDTVVCAASVFGGGYYGMLYQTHENQPWLFNQYNEHGHTLHTEFIDPPSGAPRLAQLRQGQSLSVQMINQVPWITDRVLPSVDVRSVGLLALPCGWGTAAVMLHDRAQLPSGDQLTALLHTWGAAVAAATQHQGARRLGERLVETGRALDEAQETLVRNRSMARLGEMAAGAAHEMNNPLAVISGRAQLLASRLEAGGGEGKDARLIHEQAGKLSDLITSLRQFANPPRPELAPATAAELLETALRLFKERMPGAPAPAIGDFEGGCALRTDCEHAAAALAELLVNAAQASQARESRNPASIRVRGSVDPLNGRFTFRVIDEGVGMDAATLQHAFDPFFSAQRAGRRQGLGLARARRRAEGIGGEIDLASEPGRGTTATFTLPLGGPE